MKPSAELQRILKSIDRKSYPAYKDTKGSYQFERYQLNIDHVQGDPFASPSKISILVNGKDADFPSTFYNESYKKTALCDYLLRLFHDKIETFNFKAKGSGKSGLISISKCGPEILERTACTLEPQNGTLLLRMEIGFPANGRTINANELIKILFDFLPECVNSTLFYHKLNQRKVESVIHLAEDQHSLRAQLPELNLVAFVADASILPRESGISSRPMKQAVPFISPKSMKVTLNLPHHGPITGMGIKKGITVIAGGGYHGKSTLLKALESGVYNHVQGDGREYVITEDSALKIRAEDGRSIKKTDISMFVNNLPNKKDTRSFYTPDASGSTSQAANIIEGIESGTQLFLIDEDTCATNFMIRDELMVRVVHRDQEPITPFIDRARGLFEDCGISSIIVAGSCGSFFHIADLILQMDNYEPKDITELALKEAENFPHETAAVPVKPPAINRCPDYNGSVKNDSRLKIKTMGKDSFSLNKETVDLRYLEQLADWEQTNALGYLLAYAEKNLFNGKTELRTVVETLLHLAAHKGIAALCQNGCPPVNLALPRKQELFLCFNRYRGLNL